uniref:pectate lyase n=1 Tax=Meloidogyne incognita TaxID=6306 RepID=A0A914N3Q7_MELIC
MHLISTKQLFLLIFFISALNSLQALQNPQNGGPITDDFCSKFPEASETKEVDEPIIVKGEVDMHYQRLIATKKLRDDCSIEGSVKGKHIIDIEDGGTLKNVILADPAKGVWCEGSCKLINV